MERRVGSFGSCDKDFWNNLEKLRHTLLILAGGIAAADPPILASGSQKEIKSDIAKPGCSSRNVNQNSKKELLSKINKVFQEFIDARENATLMIPNRRIWKNTKFEQSRGIQLIGNPVLKSVGRKGPLANRRLVLLQHLLTQIYKLIEAGSYKTKRELYYDDVALYKSQSVVDDLLDDIACLLNVSRTHLHVLTTSKGCIAGQLTFRDADGNRVDCSDTNRGVVIPNNIQEISDIRSEARLILVVEKSAVYEMLLDSGVTTLMRPCIMVTGKGFPDVNTRELLRKLWDALKIPILGLFDADPYGIEILGTYKYGSKAMAFDVSNLAVPEMRWLGLLPTDIQRLKLPAESTMSLSDNDRKKAQHLLQLPYVQHHRQWSNEVEVMLKTGKKSEIEGLGKLNVSFLPSIYLPNKIKYGGWI